MTDSETLIRERAHRLWEQAGRPEGRSDEFWRAAEREAADTAEQGSGEPSGTELPEASYDKALADSFPASDPPGNTGITGPDETLPASASTSAATAAAAPAPVTTANEPVPDPGGTKPAKGKAAKSADAGKAGKSGKKQPGGKQAVRSGDRNDSPANLG